MMKNTHWVRFLFQQLVVREGRSDMIKNTNRYTLFHHIDSIKPYVRKRVS